MSEERKSTVLEQTLAGKDIHDRWGREYDSPENLKFSELVLDRLLSLLGPELEARILDAGCGSGTASVHLARRGFRVQAIDFSEAVLAKTRANARRAGASDRIQVQREDLLSLSFADATFDHVLCMGVLMHVAEIEQALRELSRVLRPGGRLVVSEINLRSLQRRVYVGLTRILGRRRAPETRTPAGMECWFSTAEGRLLRRHTDMKWLVRTVEAMGYRLERRLPGRFTELHLKVASPRLKMWIHRLNRFWFRSVRDPHLAFGNILIFEKARR
jgi:2-polyprenyl-3-methyl-5-hydroxy-6-metoxy-1,4-benzoquinol methylase